MRVNITTPPAYIRTIHGKNMARGIDLQDSVKNTRMRWSSFYIRLIHDPDRVLYDQRYQKRETERGIIVLLIPDPNLLGAIYPYTMHDRPSLYVSFPLEKETIINLDRDISKISMNIISGLPLYFPELGFGMFLGYNMYPESLIMYNNIIQKAIVLKYWTNYFDRINVLSMDRDYIYMKSGDIYFAIDHRNIQMYMVIDN